MRQEKSNLLKFTQQANRAGTRGLLCPSRLASPSRRLLKDNSESEGGKSQGQLMDSTEGQGKEQERTSVRGKAVPGKGGEGRPEGEGKGGREAKTVREESSVVKAGSEGAWQSGKA